MRPLVSPVVECRLIGLGELLIGLALAVVEVLLHDPGRVVIVLAAGASIFGTLLYLVGYRSALRAATERPSPAPTAERETMPRTLRRLALTFALLLLVGVIVVALSIALLGEDPLTPFAAIVMGNGVAVLLMGQQLRWWEKTHQQRLLREPRFRWRGPSGRGQGGGMLDPRDLYAEPSGKPGAISPAS